MCSDCTALGRGCQCRLYPQNSAFAYAQAANALSKQKLDDDAIDSLEDFQEKLLSELKLSGPEVRDLPYPALTQCGLVQTGHHAYAASSGCIIHDKAYQSMSEHLKCRCDGVR